MVSDELAPLEAHVEAQIKHLTAVVGVVCELRSSEEQYSKAYGELPFHVPADIKTTLKRLPQLRRVSECFSRLVHKCSLAKAAVAQDLTKEVIVPLETFTADHVEKAQHLLSELYELLQKEKAFDMAYENLRDGCKHEEASCQEESVVTEPTSPAQDKSELQLQRMHRDQLLYKRNAERLAIQQWITALHFAGRHYEARVRDVLRQTGVVYERMIASLTALTSELQEQISQDADVSSVLSSGKSVDNNASAGSEESWEWVLEGYDCHVAITGWMTELFKQLIPVEHMAGKSLQRALKLDRAMSKASDGVEFSSQVSGLIGFHGLLTVNIANPIVRTLKFTKERQERMRNELSKSLEETQTLLVAAQAAVDARVIKDQGEEKDPVRCDSLTSSEASECSVEDNNEENDNISITNSMDEEEESTPELIQLGTLEKKLALQRQEMAHVLKQTSFLAVKTMELMVQDYLKHVIKALAALRGVIRAEPADTQAGKCTVSAQPWEHITERLSIAVSDQPSLSMNTSDNKKHQCSPKDETASNRVAQRRRLTCKAVRGINEPSAVQVALSFVQSVVGMANWAAEMGFRTASAHMPQSFEERAVLVVVMVMILTLASFCYKSNQLQNSWSDLADIQHYNSEDLVHIVKLSVESCTRQVPTPTSS